MARRLLLKTQIQGNTGGLNSYMDRSNKRMKHRRLLLSLDLLPTITETLEDSAALGVPTHPSSSSSSQSQDEYMTSIQALASCPVLSSTCGPVRFQKVPSIRLFSKPQGRHSNSASLPRANPHTHRTPRASGLSLARPEEMTPWQGRERGTGDPVDWLFGQNQNQTQTLRRTCGEPCLSPTLAASLWVL